MKTRRQFLRASAAGIATSLATPYFFSRAFAQEQTMSFWALNYTANPELKTSKWFHDLETAWNDSNAVKIKVEAISANAPDYYTKLATRFAVGEGPDVFLLSPADFLRYANSNQLVDLRPYMDQEAIDDFFPAVMTTRVDGDKILGLPMEVEPMAFYYSKRAFEEADLNETDVPKTYEELVDLARRLTTPERYGVLFETHPGAYQVFTWYPFMWQGGGDVTTEDGKSSNFNHPGTIEGLKLWKDVVEAGYAPREALNPYRACNCYWSMPFRQHAKITLENEGEADADVVAYAINYKLYPIPEDAAYFHAQWRRSITTRELPEHTILDGVKGEGLYVGTYIAWAAFSQGWWGEGEVKFFIDGDSEFPTIVDGGTEDYFGGAWCYWKDGVRDSVEEAFNSPYLGLPLAKVDNPRGARLYSLYRWHINDSIGFSQDLKVTVQTLSWYPDRTYQPATDDLASVAYWYQREPHAPYPALPRLRDRWGR